VNWKFQVYYLVIFKIKDVDHEIKSTMLIFKNLFHVKETSLKAFPLGEA